MYEKIIASIAVGAIIAAALIGWIKWGSISRRKINYQTSVL